MQQQINITTGYYVKVDGQFVTRNNKLFYVPDNGMTYNTKEEAQDVADEIENAYLETINEIYTPLELAEAVANYYNQNVKGWDFQHNGHSRYDDMPDIINNLESTLFCGKDIHKYVCMYADEVQGMTIAECSDFFADWAVQAISKHNYQDVTFTIQHK